MNATPLSLRIQRALRALGTVTVTGKVVKFTRSAAGHGFVTLEMTGGAVVHCFLLRSMAREEAPVGTIWTLSGPLVFDPKQGRVTLHVTKVGTP